MSVFYSKPQRLDVYADNVLVAPTNAEWNAANTDYILKKPTYPGANAEHSKLDFAKYSFVVLTLLELIAS